MYEYEYTCGLCLIYWGARIILNITGELVFNRLRVDW